MENRLKNVWRTVWKYIIWIKYWRPQTFFRLSSDLFQRVFRRFSGANKYPTLQVIVGHVNAAIHSHENKRINLTMRPRGTMSLAAVSSLQVTAKPQEKLIFSLYPNRPTCHLLLLGWICRVRLDTGQHSTLVIPQRFGAKAEDVINLCRICLKRMKVGRMSLGCHKRSVKFKMARC